MPSGSSKFILLSVCFALFVVMLGAYTRLTDAGLGCPDWPGCYGHMVLPNQDEALSQAQANYPAVPIEQRKAWTEMLHRYAAGTLGLFILSIGGWAVLARYRQQPFPFWGPMLLIGLLFFQAALGMWTVTWKLLPVVVMGHLLGGISILATLWWCYLASRRHFPLLPHFQYERFRPWAVAGVVIVFCQIALGGWVSSNYAGLSCIGFPTCNGQLWPSLDFAHAFDVFSAVGANYQGGRLDSSARITIQFVHRLGAVVTFLYVASLATVLFIKGEHRQRRVALITLACLVIQFSLGIINVVHLLPLSVAVAHNGVAAVLLLCMLTIVDRVWYREKFYDA